MRLLAAALVGTMAFSQGYDKTKWGMTPQEVKDQYPGTHWTSTGRNGSVIGDNGIRFQSVVADVTCDIVFLFPNGRLGSAMVSPVDDSTTISAFRNVSRIKEALVSKYGAPQMRDKWITEDSIINFVSMSLGDKYIVMIKYTPKASAQGL